MARKPTIKAFDGPIDEFVGSSYDVVKGVYDDLPMLRGIQQSAETLITETNNAVDEANTVLTAVGTIQTNINLTKANITSMSQEVNANRIAAQTAASNAGISETNAATSAANALASENASATSEAAAKVSEVNSDESEVMAKAWADTAYNIEVIFGKYSSKHWAITSENSAVAAGVSETNAANSAAAALTSKNAASVSETNSVASETAAKISETNAAASETAASASETNAKNSKNTALTAANNATISEQNASDSALSAATSEMNASDSASASESSRLAAEQIFDQFGDRYLGSLTSDPTTDNDGNPLVDGAVYWNTTNKVLKFYTGTDWVSPENVASTYATQAKNSADAASLSETNALASENLASTSETNAANSEQAASISEINAANSEANATTSETNAATSETNALVSKNAAATSEANAATSEANALASENAAKTSETKASASETNALTSENKSQDWAENPENIEVEPGKYSSLHHKEKALDAQLAAELAETNAKTSETNALVSQQAAKNSEDYALASEQAAKTSELSSANSASYAAASETAAKTSETNAAASKLAASVSEDNAYTSEVNANSSYVAANTAKLAAETAESNSASSAQAASISEINAASSASSASASEAAALASEQASKTSETSAAGSASAASTSEINASTSEDNALLYRDKAEDWAENAENIEVDLGRYSSLHHRAKAENAQLAAQTSATAASNSESNAAASALAASLSETNAVASETAAKNSETSAAESASAANTSELAAADSASAASTSETNAAASENVAATSESNASTSEANALASKNAAGVSETNAATSASEALSSSNSASSSAAAAGNYANNAQVSETNAASSELLAEKWATEVEDTEVVAGKYSATHWAMKAAESAADAAKSQAAMAGALFFAGQWDASTGTTPSIPTDGSSFYKISFSGVINGVQYNPGDQIVYDNIQGIWFKIDGSDKVASVNGKIGTVTLDLGDLASTGTAAYREVAGGTGNLIVYGSGNLQVRNNSELDVRYLNATNDLSDLSNANIARDNLLLGTMATEASADYVLKTTNVSVGDGLSGGGTLSTNISVSVDSTVARYGTTTGTVRTNAQNDTRFAPIAEGGSNIAGTGLSWATGALNIDNPFNPIGSYTGLRAQATTKADVGLGSVPNTDTTNAANINSGILSDARISGNITRDSQLSAVAESGQWADILNKPTTFTPSTHTHDYLPLSGGTITGDLKIDSAHGSIILNDTTGNPTDQSIQIRAESIDTELPNGEGLGIFFQAAASSGSPDTTPAVITTGEFYAQNNKQVYHEGHKPAWGEVTGKPNTFTPSAHSHGYGDVTFANQNLLTTSSVQHSKVRTGGAVDDGVNSLQASGGTRTDTLAAGGVQNAQESIDTDGNVQVRGEGQLKMGGFVIQYDAATESLSFNMGA